jgi:hypothetical protein
MIVRPSARSAASVSSVTCTSRTRSPELRWEAFMHAISPTEDSDSPPLAGGLAEATPDRSQGFLPAQAGQARTLPTDRRDPHGHGEARSTNGCENTRGTAPPSVWLARFQYLTVVRRISAALLSIRCRARQWVSKRGKHHFPLRWATFGGCFTRQALIAATSTSRRYVQVN